MKGQEEGITKMTQVLFQAISYTLRKSEKTTNYSTEWKQPIRWKLVWHAKIILKNETNNACRTLFQTYNQSLCNFTKLPN